MYGILIPEDHHELKKVSFETPGDIFGQNAYTFIGACVERNLIFLGVTDQSSFRENNNIPFNLKSMSLFDDPVVRGPVLVVLTDVFGNPVDISVDHLKCIN